MKNEIDTLVISGGGVKGISFIGVLKYLQQNKKDINIKTICTVSVGSIIGFLYAIGYTSEEMEAEILSKNLLDLQDVKLKTFLKNYGLDSGKGVINWLEGLVERKGYNKTLTFKQLYKKNNIDLCIGSTNLNKYTDIFFNWKISPNLRIIRAIRMSIGIPLVFSAIKYKGDIHVDGGIINNYPIKLFENNLDNVLGLKLFAKGERGIDSINQDILSIDSFLYHVVACFLLQKERGSTLSYKYSEHTIFVDANHVTHSMNFNLNNDEKTNLIQLGYNAAKLYFDSDQNSDENGSNEGGEKLIV